ncbi:hypothetical protein GGR56DRAFT_673619 [Xylariaceae sp. FL0804]|nr:hypothetical protein GGR56DRAFT_673619 [Xylariaceae sp. FL0804]
MAQWRFSTAITIVIIAIGLALLVPIFLSSEHLPGIILTSPTATTAGGPLSLSWLLSHLVAPAPAPSFVCAPQHAYTTEILSVDPLVVYVRGFLAADETARLLALGDPLFAPSLLTGPGGSGSSGSRRSSSYRSSESARLPLGDPVVQCVLERARRFMGTTLTVPLDDFQSPQLVRYAPGQQFRVHADWFAAPRPREPDATAAAPEAGGGATWNRPASFLAVLEDDCAGGETWFPRVYVPARASENYRYYYGEEEGDMVEGEGEREGEGNGGGAAPAPAPAPAWRAHEDGGLAVKPIRGNALFWINLHANGTGDERTRHAGLPPTAGVKTALNIWPRVYYP